MDKITVKDLEVFANNGVYEQENFLGQKRKSCLYDRSGNCCI